MTFPKVRESPVRTEKLAPKKWTVRVMSEHDYMQ